MLKTEKDLSGGKQRLIHELCSIAKKIQRNKAQGFSTDKLEAAFREKRFQAEARGLRIKDYAMFG